MTTINVDFEELREGDRVVLGGADWEMAGKVVGPGGHLYVGTVRISWSVFVSATREVLDTPQLPTEPGAYADKDGDPWVVTPNGKLVTLYGEDSGPNEARKFAPFTPLRPEPEVRADVEAEIARWLRSRGFNGLPGEVERGEYR